jgi:hypothetical protein
VDEKVTIMGMDQKVVFALRRLPSWPKFAGFLAERGFPIQLRMIDGELLDPYQTMVETWRELRLGTPQGMVTLRKEEDGITLVTWGNADAAMRQAWNAVTLALARLTDGTVRTAEGEMSVAEFERVAELPAGLQREQ